MSFPPGTEMFQFPGFAFVPYGFRNKYPHGDPTQSNARPHGLALQ